MYEILDSGLARVAEVEKVSSDNHSIHWQSAGTLTLIAAATEGNLRELRSIYPDSGHVSPGGPAGRALHHLQRAA